MRGTPVMRLTSAMAFIVAAMNGAAAKASQRQAMQMAHTPPQLAHTVRGEASSGAFNYRGGPGNKRVQRAAQKRRNVQRHRKACRGFASTAAVAVLSLAGLTACGIQTNPPVFDTSAITITYKPTGDHPGEPGGDRNNGASWEYWANHRTYILLGKDGAAVRMPEGADAPATRMQQQGDTVQVK